VPHEIDLSTGTPAIAYVGEKPWHGLGQQLKPGTSLESWLRAAGLDWKLERLPVQYLVHGQLKTMDDRFVLVRSDTHAGLSVVSHEYQIVQPSEVLEFYRDLVETCGYTLDTAGALDCGRKVWALARAGRTEIIDMAGIDELAAYVLLATSCDKTLATTAAFTSIRVVCQNTLFFAFADVSTNKRQHIKVAHNICFQAEEVKEKLGLIDQAWCGFIEQVRKMAAHPMDPEDAASFFQTLFPQGKSKRLSNKAQREYEAIVSLFPSAPGQEISSAKGTLWGAVNAVSYYTDHVRTGAAGDRLNGAWFGAGLALKERAWHQALSIIS
jgi:phage/plasmid-like protein (TIGR03299 family)